MNQDFGLSMTPANARRLLRFQNYFSLGLSDDIRALAEQDRITEDHFDQFVCPYSKVKETITQFLLDCNLRGIIQQDYHPEFSETALLNVIKIREPQHITIFSLKEKVWQLAAKTLQMNRNIHFYKYFNIPGEDIDKLRNGVLVIDLTGTEFSYGLNSKIRDFGNEFPQTMLFAKNETIVWTTLARAMFPTMPHPLYARVVKNVPKEWYDIPLSQFATFYNVCLFPEYITDQKILDLISDDNRSFHNVKII